jgi:hypothetical protein
MSVTPSCKALTMASENSGVSERTEPTDAEMTEWTSALLAEIDDALSSDVWAILDTGSDHATYRLYDAAALRHCAALLEEIDLAARAGYELATRVLIRTHIEAFLFALYIHFGEIEAVTRIAQDTRASLEATHNDFVAWNEWIEKERERRIEARDKIHQNNGANAKWNSEHPEERPRPIFDEPYVPQLSPTGVDLSGVIASFGELKAEPLAVRAVVDALTKWGPEKGFGRESFTPMYHIYRVLSGGSLHPTMHVLDAYFLPGGFIRTAPHQIGVSMLNDARITALYGTAFLAGWVLGDAGCSTAVSTFLRNRLEPDPSGGRGWSPGGS